MESNNVIVNDVEPKRNLVQDKPEIEGDQEEQEVQNTRDAVDVSTNVPTHDGTLREDLVDETKILEGSSRIRQTIHQKQ